jgi:hypothetical protein
MELEKYIKAQKDIVAYKIIDNKTVYYSTTDNLVSQLIMMLNFGANCLT